VSGVDLHDRRADRHGCLDLARVGVDEQRHAHARLGERRAVVGQGRHGAGRVQPTLGGQLLAPLGHEAALVGPDVARDRQHLGGRGHLQVHPRLQAAGEQAHVTVLDVAAVLAQVQRDRVGARLLGEQRGLQRLG